MSWGLCSWSGVNKGGEHTLRHWQQEIQGTKQCLPRAQRAPTHQSFWSTQEAKTLPSSSDMSAPRS